METKEINQTEEPNVAGHKTGLENQYVLVDHKKLRLGYTTGSCAAAAAKAATRMLLTGREVEETALKTPQGITLHLLIEDIAFHKEADGSLHAVSCAVRKDGGDDIDATDGALVYAEVTRISERASGSDARVENTCTSDSSVTSDNRVAVIIDGGVGVGRVTKPGLDQPVGNAAINHVPREMIRENVTEVCHAYDFTGTLQVVISVPAGVEIAKKTFNPRLGIVGGISILGTSGIVFPMSERALVESIRVEMQMHRKNGASYLVLTPGNFGEKFASEMPELVRTHEMKCSNFVGETIDMAVDLGFKGILFISHIGKFIKVSGGIMNTHSHEADCRAELMAAAALRAGADADLARHILATNTTEDALKILHTDAPALFQKTMQQVTDRIAFYLQARCQGKLETGAIIFSNIYGKLGETEDVPHLIQMIREQDKV